MKASDLRRIVFESFRSNLQVLWLVGDEGHRYLHYIEQAVEDLRTSVNGFERIAYFAHDKVSGFYRGKSSLISPKTGENKASIALPVMFAANGIESFESMKPHTVESAKPRPFRTIDPAIFVCRDWDAVWNSNTDGPTLVQLIRNVIGDGMCAEYARQSGSTVEVIRGQRMLVFITATDKIPAGMPELKPITIPLPDQDDHQHVIKAFYANNSIPEPTEQTLDILSRGLCGLPQQAAEDALLLSLMNYGSHIGITPKNDADRTKVRVALGKDVDFILKVVEERKRSYCESIPGLSYLGRTDLKPEHLPGYEKCVDFIRRRSAVPSSTLAKHKLQPLRGVTLVGGPGVGKSASSTLVGALSGRSMLEWRLGESKGGIVGQSEAQTRRVLQFAQAAQACVRVDDIDKGALGQGSSSYSGDGGTTDSMIQALLTQMSEPSNRILFVFTLNRIQNIKPELIRAGRMDAVFFVERPNIYTRKQILKTHIARRNFKMLTESQLDTIARAADDFSGAELEAIVVDAAYLAVADGKDELDASYMTERAHNFIPTAKQGAFKDDVEAMEKAAEQFIRIGNVAASDNGNSVQTRKVRV